MTQQLLRNLQEKYSSGSLKPNELDNSGLSLLHQAASNGQLTCLKWLVKYGGDPSIRSREGMSPAHYAAGGGHLQILQYLYDRDNESISIKDKDLTTPLYISAQEGQLDCLIWLTKTSSSQPDEKTTTGMTSSHAAAQEGRLECLRYLVKAAHADSSIRDNNGCTLLHFAAAEGHWKIVRWLIEHCGFNGEETDTTGATVLHSSARGGHDMVIQTLIKCGLSLDAKDYQNKTALDYALENGKKSSVNLLRTMSTRPLDSSRNKKRVRFNELVSYDSVTFNHSHTFGSKIKGYFFDEDIQAQFDFWHNSPQQTKRKRDIKKKRHLYKGRSDNLTKLNVLLDSPDILRNLNDSSQYGLIETSLDKEYPTGRTDISTLPSRNAVTKSPFKVPPIVPVRNGVSKIPKQNPSLTPKRENVLKQSPSFTPKRQNISKQSPFPTPNRQKVLIQSPSISRKRQTMPKQIEPTKPKKSFSQNTSIGSQRKNSFYNSIPFTFDPNSPRQILSSLSSRKDVPLQTNSKRDTWYPPAPWIPVRQNGKNLRVIRQNTHLKNGEMSLENQGDLQYLFSSDSIPSPSLSKTSNRSSVLDTRYKSMTLPSRDEPNRPLRYNTIQYVSSKSNRKQEKRKQSSNMTASLSDYIDQRGESLNTKFLKDLKISPRTKDLEFYSNNLLNQQKKASKWSTIRQGVSSFFHPLREKKSEQYEQSTWTTSRRSAPREDIFSRFSIPNKSNRKEFDDLFNSSTEGNYISTTYYNSSITSSTENRKITSLQSGYGQSDLSRFKARALDNSLTGTKYSSNVFSKIDNNANYAYKRPVSRINSAKSPRKIAFPIA